MSVPPHEPPSSSGQPPPPYGQQQPAYGSSPGYGTTPGYGAPPAHGAPPGYGGQPGWGPPQEDTTMAVLAHLSIFVFALMGPLVIYLVSKDSSPFTRHHAAEALNFHLTLTIASIVSAVLVLLVVGFFMLLAVFVVGAVLGVIAAVAAGNREMYRYPFTIRFVH